MATKTKTKKKKTAKRMRAIQTVLNSLRSFAKDEGNDAMLDKIDTWCGVLEEIAEVASPEEQMHCNCLLMVIRAAIKKS